ncbi:MAG: GIY-YIG nuclease family protein [Patescibacteria group bacterium]|nr:GIY-YIG nuclease family protein [Patescibacteria group bacterium]
MFYYVCVLKSVRGEHLYTGFTRNLLKRVKEHNNGQVFFTKPGLPWKVIYYEACLDSEDAKRREKYLKTSRGRQLLKCRLKEYHYNNQK